MDSIRLSLNKEKYYWSISSEGILICGGSDNGRNYGVIEIEIDDDVATVSKTSSNGISSTEVLTPNKYLNTTNEYSELVKLREEIRIALEDANFVSTQEGNRTQLMQNVNDILPKFQISDH